MVGREKMFHRIKATLAAIAKNYDLVKDTVS